MQEKSQEELHILLQDLQQKKLSPRESYHAIQSFGEMGFQEARPEVETYLTSDTPELRLVALKVLTRYWQLSEHWKTAKYFLEEDPDIECRMKGADALGELKRNTQDSSTLSVLAPFVYDEQEDYDVRQAAYAAMLSIIDYHPREQLHLAAHDIDMKKEVDWNMVRRYL